MTTDGATGNNKVSNWRPFDFSGDNILEIINSQRLFEKFKNLFQMLNL